jgi:hypothetical protein
MDIHITKIKASTKKKYCLYLVIYNQMQEKNIIYNHVVGNPVIKL